MRILANENFPGPVVRALRGRGHDVVWIKEDMRGAPDEVVLAQAQSQDRLLVTFDKDFGELAFRHGLPASCGVIPFRLNGNNADTDYARVMAALTSRGDWAGHFSVVEDDRIRVRPLPGSGAAT